MPFLYSRVRLSDFNATEGYQRGAGKVKETCWYIIKMFFFLTAFPFPYRFKSFLLRLFGAKIGKGLILKPRVNIHMPWRLIVGDHVWIGEEVALLNFENLIIGNNVCISQRAFICCGNHDFHKPSMPYRNAPIILKDGCWIGSFAFVGPGVTIDNDTVVTAGTVVTKDLSANSIYKGNPSTFVKSRWIERI